MTDAQIRTLDDSQAAQVQHLREIADKIERGEIAVRMCRDEPTDRHYDHIRRLALDYILVDRQGVAPVSKPEDTTIVGIALQANVPDAYGTAFSPEVLWAFAEQIKRGNVAFAPEFRIDEAVMQSDGTRLVMRATLMGMGLLLADKPKE